jgi:hypothetical protein
MRNNNLWARLTEFLHGKRTPSFPSIIHSSLPGIAFTTGGSLHVIASKRLEGVPSERDVETYTSEALR